MSEVRLKEKDSNDWDDDSGWDNWADAEDNISEYETQTNLHQKEQNTDNLSEMVISSQLNKSTDLSQKAKHTGDFPEIVKSSQLNNSKPLDECQQNTELQDTKFKINLSEKQSMSSEIAMVSRSSGWGSLFGGVVSSVLSTASEGLGNITSTVSQGLDRVIGVPDPAELARINVQEESKVAESSNLCDSEKEETLYSLKFGTQLVSGVTNLGSKVISTGLDTLEGIGKKTMDILQENDPQIKHKIKLLALEPENPNLSQVLKLAKAENEQLEESLKNMKLQKTKFELRFDVLFEHYCGLVHLEAIEILSREANIKIDTIKETSGVGIQCDKLLETLNEVKELMELEECEMDECGQYTVDDLKLKFEEVMEETQLKTEFDDILNLWSKTMLWLEQEPTEPLLESKEVFSRGLHCISEICALEVGRLHKISELLLVKIHHRTASEVFGVVQLCQLFIELLQITADGFASKLNLYEDDNTKSLISNLFAEMIQARQQIEKALQLFLPILQLGAT